MAFDHAFCTDAWGVDICRRLSGLRRHPLVWPFRGSFLEQNNRHPADDRTDVTRRVVEPQACKAQTCVERRETSLPDPSRRKSRDGIEG